MTDAPLGRRLAARVLDLLFAIPLTFVFVIALTIVSLPVALLFPIGSTPDLLLTDLTVGAAFLLAYVGQEWLLLVRRDGQTLGKGLLGLRVLSTDNQPLRPRNALIRLLVLLTPIVLYLAVGDSQEGMTPGNVAASVGLAMIGTSIGHAGRRRHRHQALHDLAAGSRVVLASRRPVNLGKDLPLLKPHTSPARQQ